jgi:LacI family transcriptional regulator
MSAKPKKRATIYDLAKQAGVSPGTVSRVLNNRDRVKAATRERVLKAAQELDLKPQSSVRMKQIAIITEPEYTDRVYGYAATLTAHLSFELSRRNLGVLLPTDPIEQLPGYFLDGVIAVTYCEKTEAMLHELEERIPVVYVDKFNGQQKLNIVRSDHYRAGYKAAEYFLKRGRERPGFCAASSSAEDERLRGFTDAIKEAGREVDEQLVVRHDPGMSTYSMVARLVRCEADALFVPGTSFQAMEFVHILSYIMGKKIPEEISIIGGENEGVSDLLIPPLTTIREPLKEMAEVAVQEIIDLTQGKSPKELVTTLPVELIVRDSVS